jgi:VanZ family protein
VLSALAAAIGGIVMRRWYGGGTGVVTAAADAASRSALRRTLFWPAVILAYVLVLVVVFCEPFDVSGTRGEWRARYEQFWKVPFANLYQGSEYNAVSDVLRKVLLWGGLGALSAVAVGTIRAPRPVIWLLRGLAIAGAAGVAGGIELAQVFLPPHVPDITDVLLGTIGAAVGMVVALRVRAGTTAERRP